MQHGRVKRQSVKLTDLENAEPEKLPMWSGFTLKPEGTLLERFKYYQSILGSLLYLQNTMHPGVNFPVNQLCQQGQLPTVKHSRASKH